MHAGRGVEAVATEVQRVSGAALEVGAMKAKELCGGKGALADRYSETVNRLESEGNPKGKV